jgi:hypothetical protein
VREDRHPIIFLSGKDIADVLVASPDISQN